MFSAAFVCLIFGMIVLTQVGDDSARRLPTIDPAALPNEQDPPNAAGTFVPAEPASKNGVLTSDSERAYLPNQIVVRFTKSSTSAQRSAARRSVGASVKQSLPVPGAQLLALSRGMSVKRAAKTLDGKPGVAYSEPNFVVRATTTIPNDTLFDQQWDFRNTGQNGGTAGADIGATTAWDRTTGSPAVTVAVVDTGVDYLHPDLAQNIWQNDGEIGTDSQDLDKRSNGVDDDGNGHVDDWRGWDWKNNDNDPMDDHFHGTHVAGTVGAAGNNNEGVAGVNWNAKIMPLKFLGADGSGSIVEGANAMAYAAENGAQVVNGSFGYGPTDAPSQLEADVIASHPNTLFVFAAGNSAMDNETSGFYPCSHPADNIVCVAASDNSDNQAWFSNYGSTKVDLAAPGVGILSTKASVLTSVNGQYATFNGTSMASPHVAGAAGLLLAAQPAATTEELKDALLSGAQTVPAFEDSVLTDGRLDLPGAMEALDEIMDSSSTSVRVSGEKQLVFRAMTGQANDVTMTEDSNHLVVTDPGNLLTAGAHCFNSSPNEVKCDRGRIKQLNISTGDGNDSYSSTIATPARVDLGDGDDDASGGSGDDVFAGGPGSDSMAGGDGTDTVDYSMRNESLAISLDGVVNDGAVGEGDELAVDIEAATGGSGDDQLSAGNSSAKLDGGPGNDTITGSGDEDLLIDGPGLDAIDGGLGDDVVAVTAGDGADVAVGGGGSDTVDYGRAFAPAGLPVTVVLNGAPSSGIIGEGDNIAGDFEVVIGSANDDVITGTDNGDVINSGAGNDVMYGNAGNDVIDGGSGVDLLDGGAGDDDLHGGSGRDRVWYATRTESVNVSLDGVANDGEAGEADFVGADIENAEGGYGNDVITGDSGSNELHGREGNDRIEGGDGNDELHGDTGADEVLGGGGIDTVSYLYRSANVYVSLDGLAGDGETGENDEIGGDVEQVVGGSGDDILIGNDSDNKLSGSDGDDQVLGLGGDDLLDGGEYGYFYSDGSDVIEGGTGTDTVSYEFRRDALSITLNGVADDGEPGENDMIGPGVEDVWGGSGNDDIVGDSGPNRLNGGNGDDTVHGAGGDDLIEGWYGNDHLFGDEGDDEVLSGYMYKYPPPIRNVPTPFPGTTGDVHGGPGNDKLYGPRSNGILEGDDGDDLLSGWFEADQFSGGQGSDTVTYHYSALAVNASLDGVANDGSPGEGDSIGTDVENMIGSGSGNPDTLVGDNGPNVISGGTGNDSISGLDGADTLTGDSGADTLNGDTGDDLLVSHDEYPDTTNCGDGVDLVKRDNLDTLAVDCEQSGSGGRVELRHEWSDGDLIEFRAAAGVADVVAVDNSGLNYSITSSNGPIEAGTGCVQASATTVSCADPDDHLYGIRLNGGDGDDTLTVAQSITKKSMLYGQDGNDALLGGGGDDELIGGTGSDQLNGGDGQDLANYSDHWYPLTLSLNGIADDGAIGESDNIGTDVEDLTGGSGNDTLLGSDFDNWLRGGGGDDLLRGGASNDMMIGADGYDTVTYDERTTPVQITQAFFVPLSYGAPEDRERFRSGAPGEYDGIAFDVERFVGGSADDTIRCELASGVDADGGAGGDHVSGCSTADYSARTSAVNVSFDGVANDGESGEGDNLANGVTDANGGAGDDIFQGDDVRNAFSGAGGDDTISVQAGRNDDVSCGDGTDIVTADSSDVVDNDCEQIDSAARLRIVDKQTITYESGGRNSDTVVVTTNAGLVIFEDPTVVIDVGYGCASITLHSASCFIPDQAELNLDLGEGDDSVTNSTPLPMLVDGGTGNDHLAGGFGPDTFVGGTGTDVVDYGSRTDDLSLSVDGVADDGATGESDQINTDVENLIGGSGNDVLTGGTGSNDLIAGAGNDEISSVDQTADNDFCGDGSDVVNSDSIDQVDSDCEINNVAVTFDTFIDTSPPLGWLRNSTSDNTVEFTFHGTPSDDVAAFECRIYPQGNPTAWEACSGAIAAGAGSHQSAALADGSYVFEVRAGNGSGNVDTTPASKNFVIDTVAPDSIMVSGPGTYTSDNTPTFVFRGEPTEDTSYFQCRTYLRGNPGNWRFCSEGTGGGQSGDTSEPLADGDYTFEAYAYDWAEPANIDPTPASYDFTVDTVAPTVTLTAPSGLTNDDTPMLNISIDDASPIATADCRIVPVGPTGTAVTVPCEDGASLPHLDDGTYQIYADPVIDAAGNASTTAGPIFDVDATGPTLEVTSPTGTIGMTMPQILYSASDPNGIALRECRADNSPWSSGCVDGAFWAGGLNEGPHTMYVRVTDAAGNATVDETSFMVDLTPPETSIDSGPADGSLVNDATPTYEFSSNEPGASFECQLNGDEFESCVSPHTLPTLSGATHSFAVRAVDAGGNVDETPASRSVTVDVTPPNVTVAAPADGLAIANRTPTVTYSVTDAHPGAASTCEVTGATVVTEYQCLSGSDLPSLNDGNNQLRVKHIDAAGNAQSTIVTFIVDATPPSVTISSPVNGSTMTTTTPALTFSVTDSSSHTEECQVDGGAFGACPGTLGPLSPGAHTVAVRSTDATGNTGSASSSFTVIEQSFLTATVMTPPTSSHNLTTEGVQDWGHWGRSNASSWDHKSSGGSQISNVTAAGSTAFTRVSSSVSPSASWSDGTPTASSSATATGINNTTSAVGNGFQFTVANVTNAVPLSLKLYVGVTNCTGRLELFWSSNPSNVITNTGVTSTSTISRMFQIQMRPPQATDTLNVRWVQNTNASGSKVRLYHASLNKVTFERAAAPASVNLTTEATTGATALDWAHWGGAVAPGTVSTTPIAKVGGTYISNATNEGSGTLSQATSTTFPVTTAYSWSDGEPSPVSATNVFTGIANTNSSTRKGFSFTVPASSTNNRVLKLYVGAANTSTTSASPVRLELLWGTSSIPFLTDTLPSFANSTQNYVYTINLGHRTNNTSLKVRWISNTTSSSHRAILQSAVLVQK